MKGDVNTSGMKCEWPLPAFSSANQIYPLISLCMASHLASTLSRDRNPLLLYKKVRGTICGFRGHKIFTEKDCAWSFPYRIAAKGGIGGQLRRVGTSAER